MNQIINNPWIPTAILLVLVFLWIVLGTAYQISLQEDNAIGHSHWPVDLTDFHRVIVEIDLPIPIPSISIYNQLVKKYNLDPLGA